MMFPDVRAQSKNASMMGGGGGEGKDPPGQIDYTTLLEEASLGVVCDVLRMVERHGSLFGGHYFYLAFMTAADGVEMSPQLMAQYPSDMTIVLQRQFWDLSVDDHGFCVTLSFNRRMETIKIPFSALTRFADPSVNFVLHFQRHQSGKKGSEGSRRPRLVTTGGKIVNKSPLRDPVIPFVLEDGSPSVGASGDRSSSSEENNVVEKVLNLDDFREGRGSTSEDD